MQESARPPISAADSIREGLAALLKAPFRGLLVLAVFVSIVSSTMPVEEGDQAALVATAILLAASLYLQIATSLAAAEAHPEPSVDVWLKRAFARRCFWRYAITSILVVLLVVAAGVLGLIVGGFVVGGITALADPAVVLERRPPADAIRRSAELSKPARKPLIVVFGLLVLVPGIGVQVADLVWDLRDSLGAAWSAVPIVVLVLGLAAAVALARAFVTLGGRTTPPEELRVKPRTKS